VISVRVKVEAKAQAMSLDGDQSNPQGSPYEQFFRQFGQPDGQGQGIPRKQRPHGFSMGQGSGFFISADGYAVTNNHVVEKASDVEITTDDGKTYPAKVIGTDPRTDLALIKVDGRDDFPVAKLAAKTSRVGDWVLAVGNPFGLGGTVTAGIVSARGRDIGAGPYDDFVQIDAPVNKGNSGGPTFDVDGQVVGVNTAIFSPTGGSVGIAFAIPAETVKTVVAQLKDKGFVQRGWIGVEIQPVTQDIADSMGLKKTEGALVAELQADSPATKIGIQAGDVILSINDSPLKDARDLAKKIGGMAPGSSVKIGLLHKGSEKTVSLILGELPKVKQARADAGEPDRVGADVPKIGLSLAPAANVNGAGNMGAVVTDVDPDGIAADHGFKTGDVILDVGGKVISNPGEVRAAMVAAHSDGKSRVLMRVKSGEATRFVAIPVGKA
jgi:serine protease Do